MHCWTAVCSTTRIYPLFLCRNMARTGCGRISCCQFVTHWLSMLTMTLNLLPNRLSKWYLYLPATFYYEAPKLTTKYSAFQTDNHDQRLLNGVKCNWSPQYRGSKSTTEIYQGKRTQKKEASLTSRSWYFTTAPTPSHADLPYEVAKKSTFCINTKIFFVKH